MIDDTLLSVKQVASRMGVTEETVRRWIRSRKVRAVTKGNAFYIDPWQLSSIEKGSYSSSEDEFDLMTASMGLGEAFKGAILFDNAYFEIELQFSRIQSDNINLQSGLEKQKSELDNQLLVMKKWSEKLQSDGLEKMPNRPVINNNNRLWVIPQKTLFADIHYYFIAGAQLDMAVKTIMAKITDPRLTAVTEKYSLPLKELNDARNNIEHLDERMERISNLGNIINGDYHFNGQVKRFYIEEIRELRNELCDCLLLLSQETIENTTR